MSQVAEVEQQAADLRRALAAAEAREAVLRAELQAALDTCEKYFAALDKARSPQGFGGWAANTARWPSYLVIRELAKLMSTLGLRRQGAKLWERANRI